MKAKQGELFLKKALMKRLKHCWAKIETELETTVVEDFNEGDERTWHAFKRGVMICAMNEIIRDMEALFIWNAEVKC